MPRKQKSSRPVGRPSGFTQAIADEICQRLITPIQAVPNGPWTIPSLRKVLEMMGSPTVTMFMRWLAEPKMLSLREQYHAAVITANELRMDSLMDVAEEEPTETTTVTSKSGNEYTTTRIDNGGIQRNKLRVDTAKWIASKMLPKKYGDKLEIGASEGLAAVLASLKPPIDDK